jgi:hypothetical protein
MKRASRWVSGCLLLLALGNPAALRAASYDLSDWVTFGSYHYPRTNVLALAAGTAGQLYAGGDFNILDEAGYCDNIARWNGTNWFPMGSGLNARVRALVVSTGGVVYAAGDFSAAYGVGTVNRVARWNGTNWVAMGSGLNGIARALAFDASGNLYVGGDFTTAGGNAAARVARWNGSAWSALGSGFGSNVHALAWHNGFLYAGGEFTNSGATTTKQVARYNGTNWVAVGSGLLGPVYALCSYTKNGSGQFLCAGGDFDVGAQFNASVAEWDGAGWFAMGSGLDDEVRVLLPSASGGRLCRGQLLAEYGGMRICALERHGLEPGGEHHPVSGRGEGLGAGCGRPLVCSDGSSGGVLGKPVAALVRHLGEWNRGGPGPGRGRKFLCRWHV